MTWACFSFQVSGVYAPQSVSAQHHGPDGRHCSEASVFRLPRHAALGGGENPVWVPLPAHEWQPDTGLWRPDKPGSWYGSVPDDGLSAYAGQEQRLPALVQAFSQPLVSEAELKLMFVPSHVLVWTKLFVKRQKVSPRDSVLWTIVSNVQHLI